ncbi:Sds3-like-domain-containing protein [Hysterangium stoloniferum]|nr:Sds3-like-domain-containing protein [Hysterangium stoloniferum]
MRSAASSEPLSSPTPSPPQSPAPPTKPASTASARAAGFGSDSELSELSDDDDGHQNNNNNESNDDEGRFSRTRSRRKRGGVVPGDMWDWYKTKKTVLEERNVEDDDDGDNGDAAEQKEGELEEDETNHEAELDVPEPKIQRVEDPKPKDEPHPNIVDNPVALLAAAATATAENAFPDPPPLPVPSMIPQADEGKGEDDMEIDSSEENTENPPVAAVSPPISIPYDPPEDEAPAADEEDEEEDPDDEDDNSGSDQENAADDENDAEDSPSPHANEDDIDDIASSRPSSSPPTDVDEDQPKPPGVTKQPSSLMAPIPAPVPTMDVDRASADPSPSPEPDEPDEPVPEGDVEMEVEQEDEAEQDEDAVDVEQDDDDVEVEKRPPAGEADADADADADAEAVSPTPEHSSRSPTPEPDLLDLHSGHRVEALDALALIELKFALLRERLYVEKMEELVEEEGMIINGTHPELLHLQLELSTRRDKRLELAARRKEYEETSIRSRRRDEQNTVWEWWRFECEELQKDMISTHNRKRRKIERQRRNYDKPPQLRRIPAQPHPRSLPPALTLSTLLNFDTHQPYSAAYASRPLRTSLTPLTHTEVDADLSCITGGKRRFWSMDGPGGGPSEASIYMNGGTDHALKDRERDTRAQRPPSMFDVSPGQHFRHIGGNLFSGDEITMNGWGKRRLEEDTARTERERDRDRDRNGPRQGLPVVHSHSIPHHNIQHAHPSHPPTHIAFPLGHQHQHTHIHPHPHHHHVHVHHHHHAGPGGLVQSSSSQPRRTQEMGYSQPGVYPSGVLAPDKPPFAHITDEKSSPAPFWRDGDGVLNGRERGERDRERDRERERERERDRDRERERRAGIDIPHVSSTSLHGQPSSTSIGYERVFTSPFPPTSPRRHDTWDDGPSQSLPSRSSLGSPGGRLPPPHALAHPPRHSSALGSPPGRRQTLGSPSHHPSGPGMGVFPPSPRSMPITPVPAGPGPVGPKSSTSRPLSPTPAKLVSGSSGPYLTNPSGDGMRGPRGVGESFGGSLGSRQDVYTENGMLPRREPHEGRRESHEARREPHEARREPRETRRDGHEARTVSLSGLTGVGGGSTADTQFTRDRRDRPY